MGRLLVFTGDGKGKSTAAFGLVLRALGRGLSPVIFQFIKRKAANYGEHRAFRTLGVPIHPLGDGFTWRSRDLRESARLAREGWAQAQAALDSGAYDLVVLDEFTYVLNYGWVEREEALLAFRSRSRGVHLVVTGRDAPPWLIALADTVTEMKKIKHAYDQGVPATRGIEL